MGESIYWEPWQPQPGQRVRIRLSGECQAQFISGYSDLAVLGASFQRNFKDSGHVPEEDGAEGTVVTSGVLGRLREVVSVPDTRSSHPYVVQFEPWLPTPSVGGTLRAAAYAACELEPIDEERD